MSRFARWTIGLLALLEVVLIASLWIPPAWLPTRRRKPAANCTGDGDARAPPEVLVRGRDQRSLALVTAHDAAFEDFAAISLPTKRAYARRHGLWLYVLDSRSVDCARPASWTKVLAAREVLRRGHEWVMWTDADVVITNLRATLTDAAHAHTARALADPHASLIITRDSASGGRSINNGVWLLRASPWSDEFLDAVWNATQFLIDDGSVRTTRHGDQAAFAHVLSSPLTSAGGARAVAHVPQRELNSYPSNHRPGDLALHLAGCLSGGRVPRPRQRCLDELASWAAVVASSYDSDGSQL